ncbi:hypothetical protein SDC9_94128 [bioreactor metagenome]|uniref:Uncharacterized protein n=1 Tax=bioreactor metagenome TaxID=1076179 RepID=A0A645A3Y0_9ZZZZ
MELAKRETIDYESWWFCNLAKTAELIENHLKLGISSNLDIWNYAQDLLLEIPQLKSWREFHDQIWPSSLNEE